MRGAFTELRSRIGTDVLGAARGRLANDDSLPEMHAMPIRRGRDAIGAMRTSFKSRGRPGPIAPEDLQVHQEGVDWSRELDDDAVAALWREFRKNPSSERRNDLVIHYMGGHVRRIAQRLHAHLPRQVDVEDLVIEAYETLVDLIDRFDLERNIRF